MLPAKTLPPHGRALSADRASCFILAYQRGGLLDKRRRLMDMWPSFCWTRPRHGNIVSMRRTAGRVAPRSPAPASMIQPQPQADERERQADAGREENKIFRHRLSLCCLACRSVSIRGMVGMSLARSAKKGPACEGGAQSVGRNTLSSAQGPVGSLR